MFHKKLLFSFLVLVFLLFASAVPYFFISSQIAQKEQYQKTSQFAAENQIKVIDSFLSQSFSALHKISSLDDLQSFEQAPIASPTYYYSASQIMSHLKELASQLSNVHTSIAVTSIDADSFVITSQATLTKADFFANQTQLSQESIEQIFKHFQRKTSAITLPIYQEHQLSSLYYISSAATLEHRILIFMQIPISQILNNKTSYFLINQEDIFAYSSNSTKTIEEHKEIFSLTQQTNSNTFFSSNGYDIFKHKVQAVPWEIVFFQPSPYLSNHGIFLIGILLFCTFIIALILIIFVIIRFSRKQEKCRPSKKSSAEDSFAGFYEKHSLAQEQKKADFSAMTQQLLFHVSQEQELQDDFCVCVIKLKADDPTLITQCKSTFQSRVAQFSQAYFVNISDEISAIILRVSSLSQAESLMKHILNDYSSNVHLSVAISDIMYGSQHTKDCYQQALDLLTYQHLFSNHDIITSVQVQKLNADTYNYSLQQENELIQLITSGNEQAFALLQSLLQENLHEKELSPEIRKNFLLALTATISRVLESFDISPYQLLGKEMSFLDSTENWNEENCVSQLVDIVKSIIKSIQKRSPHTDTELLSKMQTYIHENYMDDIMLEDMARTFHISSKYCSALFKRLSQDTFKNYLNCYRVKMAKELLRENPKMKITELSQRVGFNSSNSFIRVFSKYTGKTPKAFAENPDSEET